MCAFVSAQSLSYPGVAIWADSAEGFVPTGWHVLDESHGDLNNDTLDDVALVLERTDSVWLVSTLEGHEPGPWDSVVYRPRILVVAFYMPAEKQYRLMLQHNTFIINTTFRCLVDPFQGIDATGGVLQVHFQLFYSCGSWYITNADYTFKYLDNGFKLVRMKRMDFHRATHDEDDAEYDFITGTVTITAELGPYHSNNEDDSEAEIEDARDVPTVVTTTVKPFMVTELPALINMVEPFEDVLEELPQEDTDQPAEEEPEEDE